MSDLHNKEQEEERYVEEEELDLPLEEVDEADYDYEDESELDENQSFLSKYLGPLLYSLLALVIISLLLFGYYLFPFYNKIAGEWKTEYNSNSFLVRNNGKQSELRVLDMNGRKGVDLVISGDLKQNGVNEYVGTNGKLNLVINKKEVSKELIEAYKKLKETIVVEKETDKEVTFKYTDNGFKENFPNFDKNNIYQFRLADFNYLLKGETLQVRSNPLWGNLKIDFPRSSK